MNPVNLIFMENFIKVVLIPLIICLTLTNVFADPPTPTSNSPLCQDGGVNLMLMANPPLGGPFTYVWSGPSGFVSNAQNPTIVNPIVANSGIYSVTVTDLSGSSAGSVNVVVNPKPNQPLITASNSTVCESNNITLSVPTYTGATVTYTWNGPSGPTGMNGPDLNINNAQTTDAGAYTVQVEVDGCLSNLSAPFNLVVNPLPAAPIPTSNSPVCDGDTLRLFANMAGMQSYSWTGPNGFTSSDENPILINPAVINSGVYNLTVGSPINCMNSGSVNITITPEPLQPVITGTSQTVCAGGDITLMATQYPNGTSVIYEWTNPNGVIIPGLILPDLTITNATPADLGNYSVQVYVDGCPSLPSVPFEVVLSNPMETANSGADLFICGVTQITLGAVMPTDPGITGMWSQPSGQTANGVVILDPADPQSIVVGLVPGNTYTFTWTLKDSGCGAFDSDVLIVTIEDEPTDVAFAGFDVDLCGAGLVILDANPPTIGFGTWSSNDTAVVFSNPNVNQTQVTGFSPGTNVIYWSLTSGYCNSYSTDSLVVTYEPAPTTMDDSESTPFNTTLSNYDVTANDDVAVLTGGWTINVINDPNDGTLVNNNDGTFDYIPNADFFGEDEFVYEVCSNNCTTCEQATAKIKVVGESDCKPPTIFTPNSDGKNDYFIINCLEFFPDSKITIFNRWGDKVYEEQPYMNNWDGTHNGGDLPVGTYYFILDLNDGAQDPIQGYFMLNR